MWVSLWGKGISELKEFPFIFKFRAGSETRLMKTSKAHSHGKHYCPTIISETRYTDILTRNRGWKERVPLILRGLVTYKHHDGHCKTPQNWFISDQRSFQLILFHNMVDVVEALNSFRLQDLSSAVRLIHTRMWNIQIAERCRSSCNSAETPGTANMYDHRVSRNPRGWTRSIRFGEGIFINTLQASDLNIALTSTVNRWAPYWSWCQSDRRDKCSWRCLIYTQIMVSASSWKEPAPKPTRPSTKSTAESQPFTNNRSACAETPLTTPFAPLLDWQVC